MSFADFENALNNTNEIELTTTGRRSGGKSSRPVWFVRQGGNVYLLPVTGSDSQWYKNVLKTPAVRLEAAGAEYSARATPVTATKPRAASVLSPSPDPTSQCLSLERLPSRPKREHPNCCDPAVKQARIWTVLSAGVESPPHGDEQVRGRRSA
jgi:deazaflavin-dependent oxidoreductase (nitroreductase family)